MLKSAVRLALPLACLTLSPGSLLGSITHTQTFSGTELNISEVLAPDRTVFSRITGAGMFREGEEGAPEAPSEPHSVPRCWRSHALRDATTLWLSACGR